MNIPSIGVGKTVFAVDGITQKGVKDMSDEKLLKGGDLEYLIGKSGKVWGAAFRSTDDSKNPIIISIGHRISLDSAIDVVKSWIVGYRIPEPIRQADKRSRVWVQKSYDGFNKRSKKNKDDYKEKYQKVTKDYNKQESKKDNDSETYKPKGKEWIPKKKKQITNDDGWTTMG